jgi:hypothetical protein
MSGINNSINPLFQIPLSGRNPTLSPKKSGDRVSVAYKTFFLHASFAWQQVRRLCLYLCGPRYFYFYGLNFRKVATDSEIRIVAELFEKLLDKSVYHSQASRGGPFYERRELGCILSWQGYTPNISNYQAR